MGGFCEKLPDASLCLAEPIPGGSKTDMPPKAEPVRNDCNASVLTYLKRGKRSYCMDAIVAREERSENM